MKDLGSLDQQLRRGEVPDGWLPALEDVDPSTVLIIIWAGRLSRRVDAFYHEALRSYGLRYSDYAVLSLLRFSGAMSGPERWAGYTGLTHEAGEAHRHARLQRRCAGP